MDARRGGSEGPPLLLLTPHVVGAACRSTWAANFASVQDRIGTVHIHDLISSYPWRELFTLLKGAKFNGWTLLEEGATTSDPIRVMKYYRIVWESLASGQ